jgi:hypothetical protein
MTTQPSPPAAAGDRKRMTSADATKAQPDPVADSPAIGPRLAIYVPPSRSPAATAGRRPGRSEAAMTTQVLQGAQIFSVCLQDRGRDSSLSFYQDTPGLGQTTTTRSRCSADAVTVGTR